MVRARSRRRVREIAPIQPDENLPGDAAVPSADQLDLGALLVRLDPADRQLLALRYLGDMTAEQIGEALGLSASGVRSRLSRLIARLREELGDD
jgi:RNA polymerase sigma factor (sigma-70 family)